MKRRNVLICAPRAVGPDRESGAKRLYDLILFFLEREFGVTFVARSRNSHLADIQRLTQLEIPFYDGIEESLPRLLPRISFDLALLSSWLVAERSIPIISSLSPHTRIVIDTIDLHFLRKSRQHWCETAGSPQPLNDEFASTMLRELNTYAAADAVLTTAPKESSLIHDFLWRKDFAYPVPDMDEINCSAVSFEARRGVVFLGNFWHQPNVSAIQFLCRSVLPRIDPELLREHPVSIVGHGLEDANFVESPLRNVQFIGWVPSVVPYLHEARISVAPLLFGAGTKRKVIQSLMAGTPMVSTGIGIEGLDLIHGEHVLCADDEISFADSMTRLLTDRKLWQQFSDLGRKHILRNHSRTAFANAFQMALVAIFSKPPKHPSVCVADSISI
jgi:glycosyltransferase involved in cell wall biosynthesis